ncbi:UNVERIFIED_CONTAM: hypothetical protein Sradi_2631800 [Sesamum radiatum]|uniref:Uncharacterized protein n=1 Tax=Sesamum radiatum TaxID=300843 RepID=A0AAW2S4Q0_SESRA
MASTVSELLWITYLLRDFGVSVSLPILFWWIIRPVHITTNPIFHERTKHLDIDFHLVRDQFKLGFIAPSHILSSAQLADLFTKSLPVGDFIRFLSKMGFSSPRPILRGGCSEVQMMLIQEAQTKMMIQRLVLKRSTFEGPYLTT